MHLSTFGPDPDTLRPSFGSTISSTPLHLYLVLIDPAMKVAELALKFQHVAP
jgi:hypothetical protein